MAFSTRIGIGAAIVVAGFGGLLLGPLDIADAHRGAAGGLALIERADCWRTATVVSHVQPATAGGLSQDIRVTVPRTALIRVDDAGLVRAAATNTGCAPRASDDFFIVKPDGSIETAAADRFAGRHWVGDFTKAGEYVGQDRSRVNA